MATRQYIGARYVPKFYENPDGTNEWKQGVSYEALTIVLSGGSSYTSKKPVPATAGRPEDESEYWALTGNYNGQVEQYRQDVAGAVEDVKKENVRLQEVVAGYRPIEIYDSYLYGQCLQADDDASVRSFECACVGEIDGKPYLMAAYTTTNPNTESGNCALCVYDLTTGKLYAHRENLRLGHASSITFVDKTKLFMITCGGGSNGFNNIVGYSYDLTFSRDFTQYNATFGEPWAIAYYEKDDEYYIAQGNSIYVYDYGAASLKGEPIPVPSSARGAIRQNLYIYRDSLYLIFSGYNKTPQYGLGAKWLLPSREYAGTVMYLGRGEISSAYVYKDDLYTCYNSHHAGWVFRAGSLSDNFVGDYYNVLYPNGINIMTSASMPLNLYVNSEYTDFFVDNSQTRPLNDLRVALETCEPTGYGDVYLYLHGKFNYVLYARYLPRFFVRSFGGGTPTVRGLNIRDCGYVNITGVLFSGENITTHIITFNSNNYVYLADFEVTSAGASQLFSVGSTNLVLSGSIKMSGTCVNWWMSIIEGSTLRINTTNIVNDITVQNYPKEAIRSDSSSVHFNNNSLGVSYLHRTGGNGIAPAKQFPAESLLNVGHIVVSGCYHFASGTSLTASPYYASSSGAIDIVCFEPFSAAASTDANNREYIVSRGAQSWFVHKVGSTLRWEMLFSRRFMLATNQPLLSSSACYLTTSSTTLGLIEANVDTDGNGVPAGTELFTMSDEVIRNFAGRSYLVGIDGLGNQARFYCEGAVIYNMDALVGTTSYVLGTVVRLPELLYQI